MAGDAEIRVIVLQPAYRWDCLACSGQNFEVAEEAEITPEQRRRIALEMGEMEPWQEEPPEDLFPPGAKWVSWPPLIRCRFCRSVFAATPPPGVVAENPDDDDDEEGGSQ